MQGLDENKLKLAFLEEVTELHQELNDNLLKLEDDPANENVINEIFRLTHSIKSEGALVGFMNISDIAHKMEDIFEKIRKQQIIADRSMIDVFFKGIDRIHEMVENIKGGGDDSGIVIEDITSSLQKFISTEEKNKKPQTVVKNKEQTSQEIQFSIVDIGHIGFSEFEKLRIEEYLAKGETFYNVLVSLDDDVPMKYPRAFLVFNKLEVNTNVIKSIPDFNEIEDDEKYQSFQIFLMTDKTPEQIQKYSDVDQIKDVKIDKVDLLSIKGLDLNTDLIKLQQNKEESVQDQPVAPIPEPVKKPKSDVVSAEQVQSVPRQDIEDQKVISGSKKDSIPKQTIRVDIDRLDMLFNLVGEMIINKSKFIQIKEDIHLDSNIDEIKGNLEDAVNDLERITEQMQMGMMQARMVPIGNVFNKFPRMVRDLSNSLQKNVNLKIIGAYTEIDRTVIEKIADPLTHLIRNAIDHGIESPSDREDNGKSREGEIILRAYQEGSNIHIQVKDDGCGINIEKIKEKAIQTGFKTQSALEKTTKSEILSFIFLPGFTTKDGITSLSGRGVGMDVVKNEIEKLRGRIEVDSKPNMGTTFTIILPLTLTIVEGLLVKINKKLFAIPISIVEETLRISPDEIKKLEDDLVHNLRDETLAILYLSDLLGIKKDYSNFEEVSIVVCSYENGKVGILVDDLVTEQEIVIKGLDECLKNIEGIIGASILGDGTITLILEINALIKSYNKENEKIKNFENLMKDDASLETFYDKLNLANS